MSFDVLKFFDAIKGFPWWIQLGMLIGISISLFFLFLGLNQVPQPATSATTKAHLTIQGVDGYGLPQGSMVKVTAIVNGTRFTYPSLSTVDWLDIGPAMSSQTFDLPNPPNAQAYNIQFEMDIKQSSTSQVRKYVSQQTISVTSNMIASKAYTDDYNVYLVNVNSPGNVSRLASPSASVRFTVDRK